MAGSVGTNITTDNLICYLDVSNTKSLNIVNLLEMTEKFNTSPWIKLGSPNVTVTENFTTAPDGTNTATKVVSNTNTGAYGIRQSVNLKIDKTRTYTFSVWMRTDTTVSVALDISDNTNTAFTVNSTWTRYSITGTGNLSYADTLQFVDITFSANQLNGVVYLWGAQLVEGSVPLDYQPITIPTWNSLVGTNLSASFVNGTYVSATSKSLAFDGVDDYIQLSSAISQSNAQEWTMTAQFKPKFEKVRVTEQYVLLPYNSAGTRVGRTVVQLNYSVTIRSIDVDSSGNIFLGGRITEYNGVRRELLLKVDSSGNLVTAFNLGISVTQTQDTTGIALDGSGNVYYTGYNEGNLVKVDATTGALLQQISGVNASITQANLVLDVPNNKAYIGGWFTSIQGTAAMYLARINLSTMTIDTSFNTTTGFTASEDVQMMILQPDGKLLVGGRFTSYKGSTYNRIIRLNSDASIDTSFTIGTGFDSNIVRGAMALQSDGKIIVGGDFTTYNGVSTPRLVRLNADGTRDTSFNVGTGFNASVNSVAIQSDGKIVVAGGFTSYSGSSAQTVLLRLNTDGTRDTTFNTGAGPIFTIDAVKLQADGKIIVAGGYTTTYSGSTANQLFRVNTDGTLDNTFSAGSGIWGAFRLNAQTHYRNSAGTLLQQGFYNIGIPQYDWRAYDTASQPFLDRFVEYTLSKDSSGVYRQYWNGVYKQQVILSSPQDAGLDFNRVGSTLKGELISFKIYNKALTEAQIAQNFNTTKQKYNL